MSVVLALIGVALMVIAAIGWGLRGALEVGKRVAPTCPPLNLRPSLAMLSDARFVWAWALVLAVVPVLFGIELGAGQSTSVLLACVIAYCLTCAIIGAIVRYVTARRGGYVKTSVGSDLIRGAIWMVGIIGCSALVIWIFNAWQQSTIR